MNKIKILGSTALLLAMIGLSGCDNSTSTGITAPAAPAAEQNGGNIENGDTAAAEENTGAEAEAADTEGANTEEAATIISNDSDTVSNNPDSNSDETAENTDSGDSQGLTAFPIEQSAHAMTNDGSNLVYGTIDGLMYSLNVNTGVSTFVYDVGYGTNLLIGGLTYIGDGQYFYSSVRENTIYRLNVNTGEKNAVTKINFADGIDVFNRKIYSVTYNKNDLLTIFDMFGKELFTLHTGIDDMVAIAHSDKYLYILSEDGDVYQTNSETGESHMIIPNNDMFQGGDSFGGVEAIDVLNNHIYLSNVNDSTVYRVNTDIHEFE